MLRGLTPIEQTPAVWREIAAELVAQGLDVGDSEAEVSADGSARGEGAAVRPAKDRLARHAE